MLAVACTAALAEDQKDDEKQPWNAGELARTTAFIWFSAREDFSGQNAKLKETLTHNSIKVLVEYPELGGFLVSATSEALQKVADTADVGKVSVQPNEVVHSFDTGCRILPTVAGDDEVQNLWVLSGSRPTPDYSGSAAAWIIDSGISPEYDNTELNVVSRRYCPLPLRAIPARWRAAMKRVTTSVTGQCSPALSGRSEQ